MTWLHRSLFQNTVLDYGIALGLFLGGLLALWISRKLVFPALKRLSSKTQTPLDDFLIGALEKSVYPLLYYGAFYLSLRNLRLSAAVEKGSSAVGAVLLTIIGVRFLLECIRYLLLEYWVKRNPEADMMGRQMKTIMPVLSVAVWAMGAVFLLDNLGVKISAVVAGLGIGGVAVALASQAVLGDMFSYFSIMLDRPFELDDFIILGDYMGTVEHIGIKTTRLRSLGGEQLVFSNKDLTDSRIRNYKRMQIRRVVFKLGVTYDTPVDKLKRATTLIRDIIANTPKTRFDRAHFASYGDFNLVFEAVYYVLSADYNTYMDVQQEINLAIKEAFEKEKIEFAFPTQTIYMARGAT